MHLRLYLPLNLPKHEPDTGAGAIAAIAVHNAEAAAAYYALDDCSMLYLQPNVAVVKPGCRDLVIDAIGGHYSSVANVAKK